MVKSNKFLQNLFTSKKAVRYYRLLPADGPRSPPTVLKWAAKGLLEDLIAGKEPLSAGGTIQRTAKSLVKAGHALHPVIRPRSHMETKSVEEAMRIERQGIRVVAKVAVMINPVFRQCYKFMVPSVTSFFRGFRSGRR